MHSAATITPATSDVLWRRPLPHGMHTPAPYGLSGLAARNISDRIHVHVGDSNPRSVDCTVYIATIKSTASYKEDD